jgi:hypothetical protein
MSLFPLTSPSSYHLYCGSRILKLHFTCQLFTHVIINITQKKNMSASLGAKLATTNRPVTYLRQTTSVRHIVTLRLSTSSLFTTTQYYKIIQPQRQTACLIKNALCFIFSLKIVK